jgi:hypothetical protein
MAVTSKGKGMVRSKSSATTGTSSVAFTSLRPNNWREESADYRRGFNYLARAVQKHGYISGGAIADGGGNISGRGGLSATRGNTRAKNKLG